LVNSVAKILIKVGNDKTLSLFKTIVTAEQNTDSRDLREKLKLTRKQCYTILSGLVEAGLVKRKINTRHYFVTTLGRIVYDSISRIEIAYSNHIPLKAIDSINMSEVPKMERIEIINQLIKNEEIRRIYLQARPYFANEK
jgi:DNA-binding MarR family transcriptional regulator